MYRMKEGQQFVEKLIYTYLYLFIYIHTHTHIIFYTHMYRMKKLSTACSEADTYIYIYVYVCTYIRTHTRMIYHINHVFVCGT